MQDYHFPEITLLITHYNRSKSLERLLTSFSELKIYFKEIIVSDDCSKIEHQVYIKIIQQKNQFIYITSPINKGLGNNINKGQEIASAPYTLYVQEDFIPSADFGIHLKNAYDILEKESKFDMARFYAYSKYPYLKSYKDGFAEMKFSIWKLGYKKFYYYSDHPHLRRSDFLNKFGKYAEGENPEKTEYLMMFSFLQKKGKGLFFENYQQLFTQVNTSIEPSTMKRTKWRESSNIPIVLLKHFYRHIKFNLDYLKNSF